MPGYTSRASPESPVPGHRPSLRLPQSRTAGIEGRFSPASWMPRCDGSHIIVKGYSIDGITRSRAWRLDQNARVHLTARYIMLQTGLFVTISSLRQAILANLNGGLARFSAPAPDLIVIVVSSWIQPDIPCLRRCYIPWRTPRTRCDAASGCKVEGELLVDDEHSWRRQPQCHGLWQRDRRRGRR